MMIKNYLRVAFRHILRHKGYSGINIFGLAVGMACCFLIFLWVQTELSYDRFHQHAARLGRIITQTNIPDELPWAVTEAPLAAALEDEFPEIESATRIQLGLQLRITRNGKRFFEKGSIFAESSFFSMFSFELTQGDPESALDDKYSVVITERAARKYFPDLDPVGETLRIFERDFKITGLIRDVPRNSHLQFDFILSFALLEDLGHKINDWGNANFFTYVKLVEQADFAAVSLKIAPYLKKRNPQNNATLAIQPLTRIHLFSKMKYDVLAARQGDIKYIYIFSSVALFVLLIACFNFMNLTTARSGNRAKEVGVRKTAGALRQEIIRQFFGESLFLACLALLLSFLLVVVLLPVFTQLAGFEPELFTPGGIKLFLGLIGIALFTGLFSGIYPAMILSSFPPVSIIRGSSAVKSGHSTFRKILVVTQFTLSIILIIGTMIIHHQIEFMRHSKLGYNKENLLYMPMNSSMRRQFSAIKQELLANPGVLSVTAASNLPSYGRNWATSNLNWAGKDPDLIVMAQGVDVDYDYFQTFQMKMLAGRGFSPAFPSDESTSLILNEAAVNAMQITDPVGKWLAIGNLRCTIIGIVQDYNFKSLHTPIEPLILSPINRQLNYIFLRIAEGDIEQTITALEKIWEDKNPVSPFSFGFVDSLLEDMYKNEQRIGLLFNYFAVMGLFIACLGLTGLVSYLAEQRTKEIGIRKILGASSSGLIFLLSKEFLKGISWATIIAWPIAYYIMDKWLQGFAYQVGLKIWIFILASLLTFILAFIFSGYQALRAALSDPTKALKYE